VLELFATQGQGGGGVPMVTKDEEDVWVNCDLLHLLSNCFHLCLQISLVILLAYMLVLLPIFMKVKCNKY